MQKEKERMSKIRIITDSASDMVVPEYPFITVLPMTIRFGDTEYKDGVDLTHREFYEKLIESDTLPTTSLISPGVFEEAFASAEAEGEDVIVITVSSKLSGTYQSAVLASSGREERVFVVDSLNAAIGEAILVRLAAEKVLEGWSAEDIAKELTAITKKIHTIALLDTLEYLKKGGRISKSVAFVGGVLSIKPVVAIEDGEVKLLGTARGSRNGNNFLIKEIEKTDGIDFARPVALGYTGLDDSLLKKYIKDSESLWAGHGECLKTGTIGAAIGTHVGPGAIAVSFFAV